MIFREWNRSDLWIALFLAAVTLALYGQVYEFEFITYDDPGYVSENPVVRKGLTWPGIRWAFTSTVVANWHPLTWLSHMADIQLFGASAGAHHLVNVFFHVLNTVLLFVLLRQMTGAPWRSAFVAALFALHPLHVESVAWVAERKDVLSALFWILTMGAYLVYVRRPTVSRYLAALLLFALGLMSKAMPVTLPVILLLMDYWPLGRLDPSRQATTASPRASMPANPKRKGEKAAPAAKRRTETPEGLTLLIPRLTEKIPFLILSAITGILALYTQEKGGAVMPLVKLQMADRISNAIVSYGLYLWNMIWPSGLAPFYPFQIRSSFVLFVCAAALIAISVAAVRLRRRFPYLLVGWSWYLVTLLPVIGLIRVGSAELADRYTYIPLIGPFMALSWSAVAAAEAFRVPRRVLAAAAGFVLLLCSAVTYVQTGHWRNTLTLFTHSLLVTQHNWVAHINLAQAISETGRFDEALAHAESAEAIHSSAVTAYTKGIILARLGRIDDAATSYRSALRRDPNLAEAAVELGSIYLYQGNVDRAIDYYERALRVERVRFDTYEGLAEAYIMMGDADKSLAYSLKALEWKPENPKLHYNLGNILVQKGSVDEGITHYRTALKYKPDHARAHNNLGSALLLKGEIGEAIGHFEEAIRIDPGYKMARENLKDARAQLKKQGGKAGT